ncbi:MAG: hypothetical protein ABSA97_11125 [Verrucomicrobiia bacterium]
MITKINRATAKSEADACVVNPPAAVATNKSIERQRAKELSKLLKTQVLHFCQMENRALDARIEFTKMSFVEIRIGLCCALLIGLFGIAAAAYCATHGAQATGSILGSTTIIKCMNILIRGNTDGQRKDR